VSKRRGWWPAAQPAPLRRRLCGAGCDRGGSSSCSVSVITPGLGARRRGRFPAWQRHRRHRSCAHSLPPRGSPGGSGRRNDCHDARILQCFQAGNRDTRSVLDTSLSFVHCGIRHRREAASSRPRPAAGRAKTAYPRDMCPSRSRFAPWPEQDRAVVANRRIVGAKLRRYPGCVGARVS